MKLNYNGEEQTWIHRHMMPGGNVQQYVENLAQSKYLKKIDFEIKKKRGNSYDIISAKILPERKFSISIELPPQAKTQNFMTPHLPTSAPAQTGLASPAQTIMAITGEEYSEHNRRVWDLDQMRKEYDRLKDKNNELKKKVEEQELELKDFKDSETKKPTVQDRLMNLMENPIVAEKAMGIIEKFTKILEPKSGSLAQPMVQTAHSQFNKQVHQVAEYLNSINNEKTVEKVYNIAYWMENNNAFNEELKQFLKSFQERQDEAAA
jgi:hypothetical protein